MKHLTKKRSRKTGLPPGTAVHIGERRVESTQIHVTCHAGTKLEERTVATVDALADARGAGVNWVHVTGVHDVGLIDRIGELFGLHPLVREDIANTDQRAKLEDYDDYVYVVVKLIHDGTDAQDLRAEQLSIVVGRDFVLSFAEGQSDLIAQFRKRMQHNSEPFRAEAADRLAYSLLDAVVDDYFAVLERFGDRIEALQDEELFSGGAQSAEKQLRDLRREMVLLRRNIWPLREVTGSLAQGGSALFQPETRVYLRDVYDHVIHMIDTLESFHEVLAYTLDIHLLNATNQMNEVIKVLTIIATLAIPPTLIASIYGMNFRDMPLLTWTWGYPFAMGLMAASVAGMLFYFRRKRWF